MVIEILPSTVSNGHYTATFMHQAEFVASINDAPHDVATEWAEIMKDLHGGQPEIKRLGICFYCSGTRHDGTFCLDCDRVFTR